MTEEARPTFRPMRSEGKTRAAWGAATTPGLPTPGGPGRQGLKRQKRGAQLEKNSGLNKPAIRRLARRGGVKRIGLGVYDEVRTELRRFLGTVIEGATIFAEHAHRMTVSLNDVLLALKRQGR